MISLYFQHTIAKVNTYSLKRKSGASRVRYDQTKARLKPRMANTRSCSSMSGIWGCAGIIWILVNLDSYSLDRQHLLGSLYKVSPTDLCVEKLVARRYYGKIMESSRSRAYQAVFRSLGAYSWRGLCACLHFLSAYEVNSIVPPRTCTRMGCLTQAQSTRANHSWLRNTWNSETLS